MMKILNVSSGVLVNERNAILLFGGEEKSIKDHYLCARRNSQGDIAQKENFKYLEVKGKKFPVEEGGNFYELLWYQYLRQNQDIVQEIMKYDDFWDEKDNGENVMNSAARVFRLVKKYGMNGLKQNCKAFCKKLAAEPSKTTSSSFEALDQTAKKLVKENYGIKSKMEVISQIENGILRQLFHIRYEEKDENYSKALVEQEVKKLRQIYNKTETNN